MDLGAGFNVDGEWGKKTTDVVNASLSCDFKDIKHL